MQGDLPALGQSSEECPGRFIVRCNGGLEVAHMGHLWVLHHGLDQTTCQASPHGSLTDGDLPQEEGLRGIIAGVARDEADHLTLFIRCHGATVTELGCQQNVRIP